MEEIKRVLYVTDSKNHDVSYGSLKSIMPLKKLGLQEIIFLHPFSSNDDSWQEKISKFDIDIDIKFKTAKDFSSSEIINVADKKKNSLITVCFEEASKVAMLSKLVQEVSVPVLVINANTNKDDMFETVIFGIDSMPASRKNLKYFCQYKVLIKVLEIVHVINTKITVKDLRDLKVTLAHDRQVCVGEGIDAEFHVYVGKTVDEILAAAKDYKGTMVVFATGIRKTFGDRLFKKDPVDELIKKAAMPVLLIPPTINED